MPPKPAPSSRRPVGRSKPAVTGRQLGWLALIAFCGVLWKSLTSRAPFFLLPDMPALPTPNTCAVHHRDTLPFCEDFTALPGSSLLLMSCDPARREWNHLENRYGDAMEPGELHIFDPVHPKTPTKRLNVSLHDFRPLGVSAATLGDGRVRVFVTNQAAAGPRIELLDVALDTGATQHVRTIVHPLIASPNGIAASSPQSFYFTNDALFARGNIVGLMAELLTAAPGGSVVHVSLSPDNDEDEPTVTSAARLALANGIAVDPATNRLWVTSSLKGVYEFAFSAEDPAHLNTVAFTRTPMIGDNLLFVPATGQLYVSGITSLRAYAPSVESEAAPKPPSLTVGHLPKLAEAAIDDVAARAQAASRAADVANAALRRGEWRWRSVFVDDGRFYGGISTGGVFEGGRYVGTSLLERGVVVCRDVPVKGATKVLSEEKVEL